MSDHLTEMLPAGAVPVSVGNETYYLSPLRMSDYARAARELDKTRPDPADVLKQLWPTLDRETRVELARTTYGEMRSGFGASIEDVEQWFMTPSGTLFRWWLMFRRRHPDITIDQVDAILAQVNDATLERAMGGNSTAPAASGGDSTGV